MRNKGINEVETEYLESLGLQYMGDLDTFVYWHNNAPKSIGFVIERISGEWMSFSKYAPQTRLQTVGDIEFEIEICKQYYLE